MIFIVMVFTKKEFDYIVAHRDLPQFALDVDFGFTKAKVEIVNEQAVFDGKLSLPLDARIKENFCYLLNEKGLFPLAFFAQETNTFYKLIPTADWPSVAIGSVPMHSKLSPKQDSYNKIKLIVPYGVVLDTCMGLGYTAILSAHTAKMVHTYEKDENVHLLATHNPWSSELFTRVNIEIRRFDIAQKIATLETQYYDCIIHDPPTFTLAPQLYSAAFYQECFRVLKGTGKMFHYTPFYKVKRGYDFPGKIRENLIKAGFLISKFSPDEGGIVCRKRD
jgi:uncharacterized protein